MASRTDLDGFLYNDEGNVSDRVTDWLATGDQREPGSPPQTPATVRLLYRATGAQSLETLWETKLQNLPATSEPIVSALRQAIIEKLGTSPTGLLRVRGWGRSQAASPGLDCTRTITIGEEWSDMALLRAELAEARRTIRDQNQVIKELGLGGMAMASAHSQSLQQLATVRAGGSAAADSSGIGGLLGLFGIVMFKPHLDALLRGEPNSLADLSERLLRKLAGDDDDDLAALRTRVLRDPEKAEQVRRMLFEDPEVRQLLTQDPTPAPQAPAKPPAKAVNQEEAA